MMTCHVLIVWLLIFLSQQGSLRYIPSTTTFDPALASEPYEHLSSPLSSPLSSLLSSLSDTSPGSSPLSSLNDTSPGSSHISSLSDTSPGSAPFSSSQEGVSPLFAPFTSSTPSPLDRPPTQLAPPPAYSHLNATDGHSNKASDPDDADEDLVVTTLSDTDATADPDLTSDLNLTYDPSVPEEGSAEEWLEEELKEEAGRNFISHKATLLPRLPVEPVTDVAMTADFGDATPTRASMATTYSYWDNTTEAIRSRDDIQDVDVVDLLPVVSSSDATVMDNAEGSFDGEGSGGICSFSGSAGACSSPETKMDTESLERHGDNTHKSTSGPVSNSVARDPEPTLSSNQDGVPVMPDDVISTSQSQEKEELLPLTVATPTPSVSEHVEPERGMLSWVRDLFLWRQRS